MTEDPQLYLSFGKDLYRLSTEKVQVSSDIDPDRIISGSSISTISQTIGLIMSGKTTFSNDETGYILGNDEGVQKFYIGTDSDYFNFDGTNVVISGTLSAGAIDIGGSDATSFHVDENGNMWLGAATFADAPGKISNAGVLTCTGAVIDGTSTLGGRLCSTLASAIDASGHFIDTVLDTSAKQILGDFTFGESGAIKMITDANNGLWISPTGILGKKAGNTTFAIGIDGNATFAGNLSAAAGTLGAITAGTLTGCTIAIGAGDAIFKADSNGIYLGNATFASAPFSVEMDGDVKVKSLQREDYHWFTPFESTDGFGKSGEAGYLVNVESLNGLVVITDNDTNDSVEVMKGARTAWVDAFSWDKNRSFKVSYGYQNDYVGNTAFYVKVGTGSLQTATGRHLGFYGDGGDLYGTVANGTNETTLDLNYHTESNFFYNLYIQYTAGVSAKFYVNGSLKGTITTNLPSGTASADWLFDLHVKTEQDLVREVWIGYIDFWQENK